MRATGSGKNTKQTVPAQRKQVNIRIESALHQTLKTLARQERRSVSQTALRLLEDGLRQRLNGRTSTDDTPSKEIAALAAAGGAFDWLADEPDLYDDTCGEPL